MTSRRNIELSKGQCSVAGRQEGKMGGSKLAPFKRKTWLWPQLPLYSWCQVVLTCQNIVGSCNVLTDLDEAAYGTPWWGATVRTQRITGGYAWSTLIRSMTPNPTTQAQWQFRKVLLWDLRSKVAPGCSVCDVTRERALTGQGPVVWGSVQSMTPHAIILTRTHGLIIQNPALGFVVKNPLFTRRDAEAYRDRVYWTSHRLVSCRCGKPRILATLFLLCHHNTEVWKDTCKKEKT